MCEESTKWRALAEDALAALKDVSMHEHLWAYQTTVRVNTLLSSPSSAAALARREAERVFREHVRLLMGHLQYGQLDWQEADEPEVDRLARQVRLDLAAQGREGGR